MCILFLHINPKPSAGRFRLILAANRDEMYKRPSQPAHHWDEDPTVIGGRDLEPGKEGGSWLALSTRGRIAALLNIMTMGEHASELHGRGSLVSDFVKGSLSGHNYLSKIATNGLFYRPFNFVTIQISPQDIDICEYCNIGDAPKPVTVTSNYMGISNSCLEQPFVKVNAGKSRFKEIVEQYGHTESRRSLCEQLLGFLKWRESHFPDPEMASRSPSTSATDLKPYSSVYVDNPSKGYGTRAHSIILVDSEGRVDFSEWAMKEPIDPTNPQWDSKHFTCQLES